MNWLKGFGIGLVMIWVGLAIIFIAEFIAAMNGSRVGLYNDLVLMIGIWFIEVILLIPRGSLPQRVTLSAFVARSVFVWLPVLVGWYLAYHWRISALGVGLLVSSTCVGYNIIVTRAKKKV